MAVSFLAYKVFDLCLRKLALKSLIVSTTINDALLALTRSSDPYLSLWRCSVVRSKLDVNESHCIGKVYMVDVVLGLVRHLKPNVRIFALESSLAVRILVAKLMMLKQLSEMECTIKKNSTLQLLGLHMKCLMIPMIVGNQWWSAKMVEQQDWVARDVTPSI
ncbi:CBS domain-containing protein CBSX5-like [Hevea brasiliensis]|uniref:CBS domain-containing protein CBSX5-like n=1 Tax=Hevea brasiliensis TaxID=3981 RepID=UPI0025D717FE|nr:CBS domain-containing protein CBSX5-like [Hevea brasiliensis]